jgi:hypothetical protein
LIDSFHKLHSPFRQYLKHCNPAHIRNPFFQQQNLFQHRSLFLVIRIPLSDSIIHLQNRPQTDLPHSLLLAVWSVDIDLASRIDGVDRVHHYPQQTSTYQGNHPTHPKLSLNQYRSASPLGQAFTREIRLGSGGSQPQNTAGSYNLNLKSFYCCIIGLCLHNYKLTLGTSISVIRPEHSSET